MKKKNLKSLTLNKKAISTFKVTHIKGGGNSWIMFSFCCLVKKH